MRKHLTKHSSKVVILAGFLSVLALLAALVSVANFSISNNSKSLIDIVNEQQEMANIFSMRDAAYKRTLLLYKMNNVSDPFLKDDLYLEFKAEAGNFIHARDQLLIRDTTLSQNTLWKKIQPLVNKGVNSQQQTVDFILNDQTELANEVLKQVLPNQEMVMAGLTEMLDTQKSVINDELISSQIKNNNYHTIILSLGLIAILLGAGIAVYVYRYNLKTELALITQQKIANSASQAKSAFLANMSHEIRTPLTAIIGFSEQILSEGLNHEEQKKLKQTIVRNSKHLQHLVNDILDLSKIESEQLELEMIAASPIQINQEIESIISKRAHDKNLYFKVNNTFPLPSSIISDSVRLKQVLLNLCSNAIKFSSEGGVTLDTAYDPDTRLLSFAVTDTGIGLSEEEQKNIFKPFIQADVSTTRKYGGTGLGLSISQLLATELGGTLVCTSIKDHGSQFILTIPTGIAGKIKMITASERHEPITNNSADNIEIKQLQGNILLAEDIKDNQELVSLYVSKTGAHIEIANDGEEAIHKALDKTYDLILMDMQMPKIDGIEAISTLRKIGYSAPIVSLTANALAADKEKCLIAGADQFLAKPIKTNEFYAVLNKYLKEKTKTPSEQENDSNVTSSIFKLTQKFLNDLPSRTTKINTALANESWEEIDQVSHYLKGIADTFGFPDITEISMLLNDTVRAKKYDAIPELVKKLNHVCDMAITSVNEINQR